MLSAFLRATFRKLIQKQNFNSCREKPFPLIFCNFNKNFWGSIKGFVDGDSKSMTENRTYTYLNPKVALMGAGCVRQVGRQAKNLEALNLIVFGKSRHGEELAGDIQKILEDAGLKIVTIPGAEPNPTDKSVMEGAEIYKKEN